MFWFLLWRQIVKWNSVLTSSFSRRSLAFDMYMPKEEKRLHVSLRIGRELPLHPLKSNTVYSE